MDRDCNTCIWHTSGSCANWDCEYVSRDEALEALGLVKKSGNQVKDLVKRSQAERFAIAESLMDSVWKEYFNGSIDRNNLKLAVSIQVYVNRIVWKLNSLNNPNMLELLPSVQPNIIYCKDCKYSSVITLFSHSMFACHRRPYDVVSIEPDDYCSYAQKKTDTATTTIGIGISTYAGSERDE